MRVSTLWQPWASLVAIGAKPYETRSYPPPAKLIGQRIAIHAAVRPAGKMYSDLYRSHQTHVLEAIGDAFDDAEMDASNWDILPHGMVVATAILAGAHKVASLVEETAGGTMALFDIKATLPGSPFSSSLDVDHFGDYSPGRWAWLLTDVQRLAEPVPAKGKQGWWEWQEPVKSACAKTQTGGLEVSHA